MAKISETRLEELFEELLDVEIDMKRKPGKFDPEEGVFATFVSEAGTLTGGISMDYALANYLGGALTQLTQKQIKENIADQKISKMVQQNLEEVCQVVFGRFFLQHRFEKSMLDKIHTTGPWKPTPKSMERVFTEAKDHSTFNFDLPKYGSGKLGVSKL